MCNQAASLSRCLTRVQDAMSTQLKSLHMVKGKGKSSASDRMQQAVDELEYLVTFNRSISQAVARTMQDLSEGVFTALRTAPIHLQSLFLDQLLIKAEEEVARSEERHSSSQSHRKPGVPRNPQILY